MNRPEAKYIRPESIRTGALIRITTQEKDCAISRVGRVHRREHVGSATYFYTEQDQLIGIDWRNGVDKITVTQLEPPAELADIPLFALTEKELTR